MDIATAGFLSTCVVTAGGVTLKWVSSWHQRSSNGNGASNGNGNGKCPLHADIEKRLKEGDERMDELLTTSKATTKLALAIAAHLNIPIGSLKEELKDVIEGG